MAGRSTGVPTTTHCEEARVPTLRAHTVAHATARVSTLVLTVWCRARAHCVWVTGTDFEGGVRAAAFVAGGRLQLPAGSTIHHPIHIADWYATFCKLAGVSPEDDTDATRAGDVPKIDSIDQTALLTTAGAPAARTEVPLSFQALIIGDLKLVLNTTAVLGRLSGYWTGPRWPTDKSHTPLEDDPGCPMGGCLFNLSADPTEHREISAALPRERDRLRARLDALLRTKFQTNWTDPRFEACTTLAEYVASHRGFAGPICSQGRGGEEPR